MPAIPRRGWSKRMPPMQRGRCLGSTIPRKFAVAPDRRRPLGRLDPAEHIPTRTLRKRWRTTRRGRSPSVVRRRRSYLLPIIRLERALPLIGLRLIRNRGAGRFGPLVDGRRNEPVRTDHQSMGRGLSSVHAFGSQDLSAFLVGDDRGRSSRHRRGRQANRRCRGIRPERITVARRR